MQVQANSAAINLLAIPQIQPLLNDSLTKIKRISDTLVAVLGKQPKPAPLPNQGNTNYYFGYYERPSASEIVCSTLRSVCRMFSGPSTVININSNNISVPAQAARRSYSVSQTNDRRSNNEENNGKDSKATKVGIGAMALVGLLYGFWEKGRNDAAQENCADYAADINLYSQYHDRALQLGITHQCPKLNEVNFLANNLMQKYQRQLRSQNILYTVIIVSSSVLLAGVIFEDPMARVRNFGWVGLIGSAGYYLYLMGSEENTKQQLRDIAIPLSNAVTDAQEELAALNRPLPAFYTNVDLPAPTAPPSEPTLPTYKQSQEDYGFPQN